MSYTILTRVQRELKPKMLAFLEGHYQSWKELVQVEGSFGGASRPTDQINHDGFPDTTLGFNYKSWLGGWEREYIHAVLNWIALKVGDRVFAGSGESPYIVYEGEILFPVTGTGTDPEIAVEALGNFWLSGDLDGEKIILQELRRLEALWS
jgi:hypothetical protein